MRLRRNYKYYFVSLNENIFFGYLIFIYFYFLLHKKSELNLTGTQIEKIMSMPDENKLNIYKSYLTKSESMSNLEPADSFIQKMDSLLFYFDHAVDSSASTDEIRQDAAVLDNNLKIVEDLRLHLRTQPLR